LCDTKRIDNKKAPFQGTQSGTQDIGFDITIWREEKL
jgi:hypothetical protein